MLGTLADYLRQSLQSLLEVLHALRVASVLLAPSLIPGIDRGGQFLCRFICYQVVLKEQCHLVTVMLIAVGGIFYGLREKYSLALEQAVSLQQPVEDGTLDTFLCKAAFQCGITGLLIKMPVKRDNDDAVTGEQGHIVDDWQEVGVHIDLELRLEVKAVLVKETGIEVSLPVI